VTRHHLPATRHRHPVNLSSSVPPDPDRRISAPNAPFSTRYELMANSLSAAMLLID
jgi:hypothetical protein